ncbi:MAG: hypothetical protein ACM32I_11475 [Nitrospirota bacterium]
MTRWQGIALAVRAINAWQESTDKGNRRSEWVSTILTAGKVRTEQRRRGAAA